MSLTVNMVFNREYIDLEKSFNCGQCFRWKKQPDKSYHGVINGEFVRIKDITPISQMGDKYITYEITAETKGYSELIDYIGLAEDDYSELYEMELDEFAAKARDFGKGIRILHQDNWEAIVSFIISQRNNIPKIMTTIDRLCKALGDRRTITIDNNDIEYFTFPTAEQIINGGESTLNSCGLGYRTEYVLQFSHYYNKNKVLVDNYKNKDIPSQQLVDFFKQFYGIGDKVANCIALFGYNRLDMFPIDVWITRVVNQYYNGSIDISAYGKWAGLVQQYMFYYIKNNK